MRAEGEIKVTKLTGGTAATGGVREKVSLNTGTGTRRVGGHTAPLTGKGGVETAKKGLGTKAIEVSKETAATVGSPITSAAPDAWELGIEATARSSKTVAAGAIFTATMIGVGFLAVAPGFLINQYLVSTGVNVAEGIGFLVKAAWLVGGVGFLLSIKPIKKMLYGLRSKEMQKSDEMYDYAFENPLDRGGPPGTIVRPGTRPGSELDRGQDIHGAGDENEPHGPGRFGSNVDGDR